MNELEQRVARAIRKRYCQRYGMTSAEVDDWDDLGGKQDDWLEVAQAALKAHAEWLAEQPGSIPGYRPSAQQEE